MKSKNKVYFVSLGCSRNTVDSEVMMGLLLQKGYDIATSAKTADYLVVNTCSFLQSSVQEGEEVITQLAQDKKKGAKVIVTGCLVSRYGSTLRERFPSIDVIVGSGDVTSIVQAIEGDHREIIGSAKSYLEQGEVPRALSTAHYAYVKIAEGCRKQCSYCTIPSIKGRLRSKTIEQVLYETALLVRRGVREIIFIAQDLGDFGYDQGLKRGLEQLLRGLRQVEGDFWIRLLYLYPDELDEGVIEAMQQERRIVPYIDMPIQHIDDRILRSMQRKTTSKQIHEIIQHLRTAFPRIFLRTSLIVGYPGETEEQFEELCAFVKATRLDHMGIFPYSREPNTKAAVLDHQIIEEIKQERVAKLAKIQQEISYDHQRHLVGSTIEVMVDHIHPESRHILVGHHAGQCPEVDGTVLLNHQLSLVKTWGDRCLVEVTEAHPYDVVGTVVSNLSTPFASIR